MTYQQADREWTSKPRAWFPPHCEVLPYIRSYLQRGNPLSAQFLKQLQAIDFAQVSEQWFKSVITGATKLADIPGRSAATLRGMVLGIFAAAEIVKDNRNAAGEALRSAVAAYQVAWGLSPGGAPARFTELREPRALPRALQAMLDARISTDEGTAPAWLAVHRLLDYLLGADELPANPRATPGTAANPVRVRLLLDAGTYGRIEDATAAVQEVGPASWYVDPVALGPMVLTSDFVSSLQLAWHACRSASVRQQTYPTAVRLVPELKAMDRTFGYFDGPSAGVLCACALYAAVTGTELDTDGSASVELKLRAGRSLADDHPITLDDIELASVGGIHNKLAVAHSGGLRKVMLTAQNRQTALAKRWHLTERSAINLPAVQTLADVFRELTGNARIERVLSE